MVAKINDRLNDLLTTYKVTGWNTGAAKIIFPAKVYILTHLLKKRYFRSIFDGTSKIWLKMGVNTRTVLVSTSKKRAAMPLGAGYCFRVYTLHRKCHILSVKVTKHFNSISKTTKPRGQAGRGRGHNCHEAEASNHEADAEAEARFFGLEAEAGTKT